MDEHIIKWGGSGPKLHLAHANSFHPGTYLELITELKKDYEVYSYLMRPFHKGSHPTDIRNWSPLRDDMIRVFDELGWRNIVGIGHSLGSTVTMMAAIKRPDLFSKLVIIEPPCVDQIFFSILAMTPLPLAKYIVPPSKIALKRRHKWSSRKEAFSLLRMKRIFHDWSDQTLKAYVQNGLEEDENGDYRLVFTKEWESRIYCTIENPYRLFPNIKVPSLCIRADNSDVIDEKNWTKWKSLHKNADFFSVPESGHLLPMEKPLVIASRIKAYLNSK